MSTNDSPTQTQIPEDTSDISPDSVNKGSSSLQNNSLPEPNNERFHWKNINVTVAIIAFVGGILAAFIASIPQYVEAFYNYDTGVLAGKKEGMDIENNRIRPTIELLNGQISDKITEVTVLQNKPTLTPAICLFSEKGGTIAFYADDYTNLIPGRKHSLFPNVRDRDATNTRWERISTFEGAVQALSDDYDVNTMNDINGPALAYSIKFENTGTYFVGIQGIGNDSDGDSIIVGMNNALTSTVVFSSPPSSQRPAWFGQFDARTNTPISFSIPAPGIYTFYIWMRENGVIITKIWIHRGERAIEPGNSTFYIEASSCRS